MDKRARLLASADKKIRSNIPGGATVEGSRIIEDTLIPSKANTKLFTCKVEFWYRSNGTTYRSTVPVQTRLM